MFFEFIPGGGAGGGRPLLHQIPSILAQTPPPHAPGGATLGTRSLWLEAAITVAMILVVLVAVCRGSHRT